MKKSKVRDLSYTPPHHADTAFHTSNIPHRAVHLLEVMHLHLHIIITIIPQSAQSTLRFTFDHVSSTELAVEYPSKKNILLLFAFTHQ